MHDKRFKVSEKMKDRHLKLLWFSPPSWK